MRGCGLFFLLMLFAGCASNSGVVAAGDGTFVVSRQAATGFSGLGTLKVDAIEEAYQYCQQQQKTLHVISATEAEPPFILGNFPKADVRFSCDDVVIEDADSVGEDKGRSAQAERSEDVYTQLKLLDELRDQGILTDAEFDAEKKKVLERN